MNLENKKEDRRNFTPQKYFLVFLLTTAVFTTGILLANKFNDGKIERVKSIEEKMYIDILSSETQFSLLEDAGCSGLTEKSVLSSELKNLGKRLAFMENSLGRGDQKVISLKRKYSLLQIKDYILMRKLSKKCKLNPIYILYFYSNKEEYLDDSKKQGYVLTKLSQDNPRLRVYAFDYDLDLPALKTLEKIKKVGKKLPVIVINDKVYEGFQSIEKIQKLLPKLEIIQEKYLKHFDGTDSKVQIQCSEDSQCKIDKDIFNPCGFPKAINVENKKEDIGEFSRKEMELTKNIDLSCVSLKEFSDEVFCNKDHVCEVKIKKEIQE